MSKIAIKLLKCFHGKPLFSEGKQSGSGSAEGVTRSSGGRGNCNWNVLKTKPRKKRIQKI